MAAQLAILFLLTSLNQIYLNTKFWWHHLTNCWDITTSGWLNQTTASVIFVNENENREKRENNEFVNEN